MTRTIRPPQLDARLSAALSLASPCEVFADIGADHGRLSAVALLSGVGHKALLSDISEKSLSRAISLFRAHGLENRAVFAVADGLDALDALPGGRADQLFMLGMGGDTLGGILRRGQERLCGAAVILGAHTELTALRQTVCDVGYRIRQEAIVRDSGRIYELFRCEPALTGEPPYTAEELLLGPVFLRLRPPLWLESVRRYEEYLRHGVIAMQASPHPKDAERLRQFQKELELISSVIDAAH